MVIDEAEKGNTVEKQNKILYARLYNWLNTDSIDHVCIDVNTEYASTDVSNTFFISIIIHLSFLPE